MGHYSAAASPIVLVIIRVSHVKRTTFCAWVVLIHADSNGPPCGFVLSFFNSKADEELLSYIPVLVSTWAWIKTVIDCIL